MWQNQDFNLNFFASKAQSFYSITMERHQQCPVHNVFCSHSFHTWHTCLQLPLRSPCGPPPSPTAEVCLACLPSKLERQAVHILGGGPLLCWADVSGWLFRPPPLIRNVDSGDGHGWSQGPKLSVMLGAELQSKCLEALLVIGRRHCVFDSNNLKRSVSFVCLFFISFF